VSAKSRSKVTQLEVAVRTHTDKHTADRSLYAATKVVGSVITSSLCCARVCERSDWITERESIRFICYILIDCSHTNLPTVCSLYRLRLACAQSARSQPRPPMLGLLLKITFKILLLCRRCVLLSKFSNFRIFNKSRSSP